MQVREALGYAAPHFPLADHYNREGEGDEWMYGRGAHGKLTDSGDWREDIDLDSHRYMLEDTRLGLSFLVSVGRWAGVATPVAEGLLNIASAVTGKDLYQQGRTFERLGLADKNPAELQAILQQESKMQMIEKIAVLGAGRMGKAIAIAFAYAGLNVDLIDAKQRSEAEFEQYQTQIRADLQQELQLLEKIQFIQAEQQDFILDKVAILSKQAATGILPSCALMLEAVPEVKQAKQEIFAWLDRYLSQQCIVASTTSTFLVTDIAQMISHPERVVNAHWLNPAYLMPLVELSRSDQTSNEVLTQLKRPPTGDW